MTLQNSMLAPLRADDAGLALRVRKGLLSLGYTGDAVGAALAEFRTKGLGYEALGAELAPSTPLSCLMRAFVVGVPTAEDVMRANVGDEFFGVCESAGLWSRVEGGVTGTVVIMVDGKTFLLSDHGSARLGELAMYWVMGIGTSTMKLACSVHQKPYARVLDLCCGGGIHAFMVSPFAKQIVAIDRNPRALNLGRFGAAMNKFGNIEFRESDCYSAVAGETFDAIICNPPYVLTPDRQTYYRDGGMGGDRFAEKILREAPEYLRDGGFAHVMCDVAAMEGKSSEERLQGWLAEAGCDVVAVGARPVDAATYARNWVRKDGDAVKQGEEARWVESFKDLGVSSVTNMLVVLRKREAGTNWFRSETASIDVRVNYGSQVARRFANQDLLGRDDSQILAAKLRVPADVRLSNTVRMDGGRWVPDSSRITFGEGLQQEHAVDPSQAAALAQFDGTRKTVDAMGKMRIGFVRSLIANSILEPVG